MLSKTFNAIIMIPMICQPAPAGESQPRRLVSRAYGAALRLLLHRVSYQQYDADISLMIPVPGSLCTRFVGSAA